MSELPAPPVAAEVDLRDLDYMPLYVARLLDSDTWVLGSAEEKIAALTGWAKAWHQKPAGSLPADDRLLAHLLGYGVAVEAFSKVKENAMRGWYPCTDGRLYHPRLAEIAIKSWQGLTLSRWEKERERLRKSNKEREKQGLPEKTLPARPKFAADGAIVREPSESSAAVPPEIDATSAGNPAENALKYKYNGKSKNKKEEGRSAPPASKRYAFEGRVLRISQRDFDQWESSFDTYPSLAAELSVIDAKYAENPPANPFIAASQWLRKGHERNLAEGKPRRGAPAPEGGSFNPETDKWRQRIKGFISPRSLWLDDWGPPPGNPSSLCPPSVVAEFRDQIAMRGAQ